MLREAIRLVRNYRNGNSRFVISGEEMTTNQCIDLVLDAAESTLPRTKMVEVWRVEYAINGRPDITGCLSREEAEGFHRKCGSLFTTFRVTGPHQQEVPDDGAPANPATDRHSK